MIVFLFASPLLNPVIIGLFVVTFGFKVTLFYFTVAMGVSVIAGYLLEKLGFEQYVCHEAYAQADTATASSCCDTKPSPTASSGCDVNPAPVASTCCDSKTAPAVTLCRATQPEPITTSCCPSQTVPQNKPQSRRVKVWRVTWKDFKQVLPYLFIGVLLGSMIYGFMPTELIVQYAGEATWYAILIAALIGIPLYIRAEAVIPLSAALIPKGMAMGSVMTLIIRSPGASLTEVILLEAIFKGQMIAAFLSVILGMTVGAVFLYSYLFS